MSSTGRGRKGGGEREFFSTPRHPVHRFLERVKLPGGDWIEAGAGTGAIIRAVQKVRQDVRWTAVEKHAGCAAALEATGAEVVIGSFEPTAALFAAAQRRFRVALFNPPFSSAFGFVRLCLLLCDYVACLQRSSWIGDEDLRFNYFKDNMPDEYRVGRIDFDGRGGDSTTYSWFVWGPGRRKRDEGKLVLLPRTSLEERQLDPRQVPLFLPERQLELAAGGGR